MGGKAKSIAVITARGGSKRIYKKNIKDFLGKPIIQYSIEAAINSLIFDEVMVSTDDDEIAGISLKLGAAVPFMRSEKTSDDYATTTDVIEEVLNKYKKIGFEFNKLCCIYPTAPFITPEKLKTAMSMLTEGIDSVIPVVPFSFPPQRGFIIESEKIKFRWPENMSKRSQDLERMYHDSGQFYCININSFYNQKKLIMENTLPIILSDLEVQDIDNENDWEMAQIKYKKLFEK